MHIVVRESPVYSPLQRKGSKSVNSRPSKALDLITGQAAQIPFCKHAKASWRAGKVDRLDISIHITTIEPIDDFVCERQCLRKAFVCCHSRKDDHQSAETGEHVILDYLLMAHGRHNVQPVDPHDPLKPYILSGAIS